MYKFKKAKRTSLRVNKAYVGERIEEKVDRILNNNEPITDGAPIIYQTREEGLRPQYDIRTDRWDIAIEASDHITKTELAKRQERIDKRLGTTKTNGNTKTDGTESTQGTND